MLDKIIKFSIKNKLIIGVMTLLLIIWGVWSASKLPIDAVPDITNNQVQIITVCPTLAGQEVEQLVTFPIEQSIANIPNLEEVRSISRFGLSVITVVFKDEVNIYFARQLLNEKLKQAEESIPKGIGKPELAPVSTGLGDIYQYIVHPTKGNENKYTAKDLRTMQDWIVRRQLNGTPGIAEVNSFGGELKQYEVSVNPNRLKAMGVSISDIFKALEKNNQNTGGAYIDKKPNAYFIRGIGLVTSLEDVKNIVVKTTGSIPIFIKDVAEVKFGKAIRYGAMTFNGEVDAVGGVVMMLKGENSNEVVQRIKAKIPTIQKSLPNDVIIEPYLDRSDLVARAISTVEKNLIEGALIVIFVLVLFLGNFRAGLIVASAIPLSMLFALGLMNVFGVSANLMSLGAIDFGLIVDGAVIVVEATLHHLGLRKSMNKLTQSEMDNEVFVSASKIRSSAAFGEIIILIVYIPILSLIGIEGKMFRPMAQTVGFAILGALILSLTYIPMMCALFLPKLVSHKKTFSDKMMDFFQRIYQPLLQKAIQLKYWLVGGTVTLFVVSIIVFSRMGGEFIPTLAEGDFAFHCILPQGSSLSQSLETSMQASRIVKQFDEVKMVVGKTGAAEVPTDPMPPEATDLMIILKPQKEWKTEKSYDELADEISEKLPLDKSNISLIGFSQGAILSYGMAFTFPEKINKVVALSGYLNEQILPENYDKVTSQYPDINPAFLFLTDGYNFKNTEINAVLGIEQLKRLDENIQIRKDNYEYFIKKLIHYEDYFHIPDTNSSNSSYAFPIICKDKSNRLDVIKGLDDLGVEHRPIVSGNLLKHPFLHKWKDTCKAPNADILHYNGVYVGNSQFVTKYMIERLFTSVINNLSILI